MHGIAAFALAGVHALDDDRSSLILTRIAAGKEDGNDADADNKIESDLSHEISEDEGLADLSRQLDKVCTPLSHDEMDMDMPTRDGNWVYARPIHRLPGEDGAGLQEG